MSEQPLVSLIIPAYNAEKTLRRTLESARGQTWKNMEIILVDDGSKDDTPRIARETAEEEPRLRVITQECRGVAQARNRGLEAARGQYIRFMDADDTMPPESTELLVRKMEADGSDLVIGGYKECLGKTEIRFNLENRDDSVAMDDWMGRLCKKSNAIFYGVVWNKLFLRDKIEAEGLRFPDGLTFGEDLVFVLCYMKTIDRISFLKEYLYDYRRTVTSMTFRQSFSCVIRPIKNIRTKWIQYLYLKKLYIARGCYDRYKSRLWHYLFRVGLDK